MKKLLKRRRKHKVDDQLERKLERITSTFSYLLSMEASMGAGG